MATADTEIILEEVLVTEVLTETTQGPPGPAGPQGPAGVIADVAEIISADENNRLTKGSDAKLLVPDLGIDPLPYYILSKS